ncbi:hypothetical protein GO730_02695 [Spirosoma sp. HMF3257]|uniref:Insecticide toxin TcdB middle/N-terminal domain-containing protein n=1 Tax=Spirosoma telluris TaxID=2183553 RepID=A0A327NHV1_9BACT|nr:hypothetical protein [Spirosoma telluris]RAI73596.1 hypothetical protein HMF3257_02635 [Spirosoma telluris]
MRFFYILRLLTFYFLSVFFALPTWGQSVTYSDLYTASTFDNKTINVGLAVGSTNGIAGASVGATYSIPIAAASGTNGVGPQLSINYSSSGGNGVLGMGWSLSGLSIISRIALTVYHDGAAGPVELSNNDRFALDGIRLIATNGTYGDNNTTYGTESETFSTVTSYTQGGINGVAWFKVVTKEGVTMEFGNTADSRFMNQANNAVLFWRLNKVQHPDGNYIEFVYDNTDRDSRISQIHYTGNTTTGLLPYNTIEFGYKIRFDIRTIYEAGSSLVSKYLLDNITVKAEGSLMKKYQFDYAHNQINSYLKAVTEMGSDNSPLNPTVFKYGDTPVHTTTVSTSIPVGNNIQAISGDYDGDGKREILAAHQSANILGIPYFDSFTIYKANATGTGYSSTASQSLPPGFTIVNKYEIPNSKTFLPNDFTGDGVDDILTLNISYNGTESKLENVTIYKSTNYGTSFVPEVRSIQPNYYRIPINGRFFYPGDFDGDGISEYITILGNTLNDYEPFICSSTVSGACSAINISGTTSFATNTWTTATDIRTLDFNGDGKTDLMVIGGNVCEIFSFTGNTASRLYTGTFPDATKSIYIGDFNGDGKTDLLQADFAASSAIQATSTGNGFNQTSLTLVQPGANDPTVTNQDNNIVVGDFNGDGRSDFYYKWGRTRTFTSTNEIHLYTGSDVYYSQGDAFLYKQLTYTHDIYTGYIGGPSIVTYITDFPVDFNGDGKTDLVSSNSSYLSYTLFNKDGTENLLHKVSNGFNHITEWTYKNLTEGGSFYYRSSTGNYPVNAIQPALYAVWELKVQNGIGGIATSQYTYGGAMFHRAGKGFLGFTSGTTNNLTTGINTLSVNEFSSQFFVQAPKETTTYLASNGAELTKTTQTNQWVDLGNKRFWYRVNGSNLNNTFEGRTASTTYQYDSYGNITQRTVNNNNVETTTTQTQYQAFVTATPNRPTFEMVTKTRSGQDPYQVQTVYQYTNKGQLSLKVEFYGQAKSVTTSYGYHNLGYVNTTTVSPSGLNQRSSSASYDDKGRYPTSTTNELGQTASASYDNRWGKPLTETGIDGLTTSFEYDVFGRRKKTNLPEGYSIQQSYGWDFSNGALYYTNLQHPGKPDVKTWYDVLGRQVMKQTEGMNGQWITQTQYYDTRGNVAGSTQPYLPGESVLTTTNGYDEYNRQINSVNPAFGTSSQSYAYSNGNLTVTTTNPANQQSTKTTDASGQVVSASDVGGALTYTYYSHGGVREVKKDGTVINSSEYDVYGRQTKLIDANAGTTTYDYDALGQLLTQTNANGQTHTLQYDLQGRVTSRSGPEGTTTTEYYGSLGSSTNKLKKVTSFAGNTTEYAYDSYSRLQTITQTVDGSGYTTTLSYNTYGDVTSKSYSTGFGINNNYDGNGYLTSIKNSANSVTLYSTGSLNGLGQIKTYSLGNGKNSSIDYFYGTPTRYYTPGVQDLNLSWNFQAGNLNYRQDAIKNKKENFTYDNLNRLTSFQVEGQSGITMNYAVSGNINSKTDVGSYSYLAGKPNAVEYISNPSGVISTQQQLISYTGFLQPQTITENGYELTYTYGAGYDRYKGVLKQNGNVTWTRYYLGDQERHNNKYLYYIQSPAGLAAIVVRENGNESYYYTYTDHLGSILTATDGSGNVVAEQNFDPWGRRRNVNNWTYSNVGGVPDWLYRGYTGHEMLDPFVLINMNGRIYDPVAGRVLSPDNYVTGLVDTQAFNRYSYALNNPLKYTDPDGNNPILGAIIGGLGYFLSVAFSDGGFNNWNWGQFAFSAIAGAVTSGFAMGIGDVASGISNNLLRAGFQLSAHGLVGGYISVAQGGNFGTGLLTSAAGSIMGSATGALGFNGLAQVGTSALFGG